MFKKREGVSPQIQFLPLGIVLPMRFLSQLSLMNRPKRLWTVERLGEAGILEDGMAEKFARCRITPPDSASAYH